VTATSAAATPAVATAGRGLGRRCVELDRAALRLASFAGDATLHRSGPSAEDCRALVMRALHVATAPATGLMLRTLADGAVPSADLATGAGRPRLAAWEEVSDLVQNGLAERDVERDLVRPTAAGRAVVELVDAITASALEEARP
jgi:hypothetical protein